MKIEQNILKILDSCRVEGNILYLPDMNLDRKVYQNVNKILENIGGKWNRKVKGHVFNDNPIDLLDNVILTGEVVDVKKEFQYFPTPKQIGKLLVEFAEIKDSDIILEPSAGQGAIVELFPKENKYILIELNQNNCDILRNKGFEVLNKDFLETDNMKVDKILMNPPFSKQQDVDHIIHAYDILKEGGILVSIVSESPFFRENKKSIMFRKFLDKTKAEVFNMPKGSFKDSGTMVNTKIIKIKK